MFLKSLPSVRRCEAGGNRGYFLPVRPSIRDTSTRSDSSADLPPLPQTHSCKVIMFKSTLLKRNNGRNVYWESNLLVRKQRILSGVIVVLCTDVRSAAALVQLLCLAGFSRANMNVRDGVRPQKHRFNASHFNYLSYSFSAGARARSVSTTGLLLSSRQT